MTVIVLTSSTIGRTLKLTNRKLPPTRPQRRDTNKRGETAAYPSVLELVHVTNIRKSHLSKTRLQVSDKEKKKKRKEDF